ncbi:MAG: ATP-dependent 6-phosphofructokinase [Bdellovibrionales bacterium]|jgi:6-phosphofructokinase 1
MSSEPKKIAILTSGGDCAGLNAVIRSVVLSASALGWEVFGLKDGTQGLIDRPIRVCKMTVGDVGATMLRQGGTVLGTTNKGNPFAYPMPDGTTKDMSQTIIEGFRSLGCEAMIGIGGDGSLAILRRLAQQGQFTLIGIPKTIDNDLGKTETAIGFDTAVSVATEALDRLQPTAASHDRIMILEVMGRDAGHIALATGIAGGADVILVPEIPYSLKKIASHIKKIRENGRNFALIVVSEAVKTVNGEPLMKSFYGGQQRFGGIGHYIGSEIAELCQAETRVTVLGHVQRGGQPSAQDRMLAAAFGVHAVELIRDGKDDRMVAWSNREVIDVPILDAISNYQMVDPEGSLVKTARGLGICLGN